jgi:hypothetical protein
VELLRNDVEHAKQNINRDAITHYNTNLRLLKLYYQGLSKFFSEDEYGKTKYDDYDFADDNDGDGKPHTLYNTTKQEQHYDIVITDDEKTGVVNNNINSLVRSMPKFLKT